MRDTQKTIWVLLKQNEFYALIFAAVNTIFGKFLNQAFKSRNADTRG